jgi:hypothetical protein
VASDSLRSFGPRPTLMGYDRGMRDLATNDASDIGVMEMLRKAEFEILFSASRGIPYHPLPS